jgi:hypothetical protein
MTFSLCYHRRPRVATTPSAAATVLYMVMMFLLMAIVESACVPMVSHASIHQGEGLAWVVLAVAAYRLGSKYRYPNGAFLLGMASALVFQQRYVYSMPIRRAVRCGDTPPDMAVTLITWFTLSLMIGWGAWLLAHAALGDTQANTAITNETAEPTAADVPESNRSDITTDTY